MSKSLHQICANFFLATKKKNKCNYSAFLWNTYCFRENKKKTKTINAENFLRKCILQNEAAPMPEKKSSFGANTKYSKGEGLVAGAWFPGSLAW